jgi:hypothetical protein
MRAIHLTLVLSVGCPFLGGCGSGAKAVGAAANVALGVAVGGIRRATGDCYTWCDPNHVCNPKTGLCEPIDCGGKCGPDERCDASQAVPTCVPVDASRTIYDDHANESRMGPFRMLPPPDIPPPEELP